uniref:Uncharacterized protein n=1 Tax=Mustela putorius furo TaxID=9669 RepID=M3Z0P5_MUSPF
TPSFNSALSASASLERQNIGSRDKGRTQNYPHHISRLLRRESPSLGGTLRQDHALSPLQTAVSSPSQDSSHHHVCLPASPRE